MAVNAEHAMTRVATSDQAMLRVNESEECR
jgi:hypothetical protein